MPTLDDILEHHGIKGMHWGVRRDDTSSGSSGGSSKPTRTEKKVAKADAKWEKSIANANQGKLELNFRNEAVMRLNSNIDALNSSDKYRGVDTDTFKGQMKEDYEKDAHDAIMRSFEDATRVYYGNNASGTKRAVYNRENDQIEIRDRQLNDVQHTDNAPPEAVPDVVVKLKRDKVGKISSLAIEGLPKVAVHSISVEEFLEHHGIKGMRWGVRREDTSSGSSGGSSHSKSMENLDGVHKPSEDATRAKAASAKIKSGGTETLSNKELQDLVTRMNLEQQYTRLSSTGNSARSSAGKKFAKDILVNVAKQQVSKLANDVTAKQIAKLMVKATVA